MTNSGASQPPTRLRLIAITLTALAFVIPAVTCIVLGISGNAQYHDAGYYHLPTIHQFAREWPAFNFRNYSAAMTPGYHLLMAALVRAGSCDLGLQFATAALSTGLIATLAWCVSARAGSLLDTLLICLPIAWSPYILPEGIYAVPHNFAWWAVLLTLIVAMHGSLMDRPGAIFYLAAAFGLAWAVITRQIHVWTLAPIVTAAWVAPVAATAGRRATQASLALLAAVPALLILAYFVRIWGGLTPPAEEWVRPVPGVNVAAITMMIASLGMVGVWFVPRLLAISAGARGCVRWGLIGAAIALFVALVGPSTYDLPAGRWSGLWNLVRFAPVIAERSLLIVGLAGAGGFVAGVLIAAVPSRQRWVLAAGLAGFAAAHATINQAWQRYYEPMMLLTLALAVSTSRPARGRSLWQRLPLVGLIILEASLSAMTLLRNNAG